ncbi:MAG: CDP-glucose 4,6-dehydratase [Pseudomonadota bacterium]
MAPFLNHFKNKKVFVTGHTGFKGAWLSLWLTTLGAEVTGYSLAPPSTPSLFEALNLADHIAHIHGDILDPDRLGDAMRDTCPDIVFHLAAQALVLKSYTHPVDTVATNVIGSANVMEAVRNTNSVRTLVSITTDKCYDNLEQPWGYRENDPLGGHDPYSASKAAMEIICASWNKSFFKPEGRVAAATARAGNVIGGGDFGEHRLIPDYVRAVLENRPLQIRMPHAVRPWQHVLEPLSGYLWLAVMLDSAPGTFGGAWNFAPADNACSVRELVETVKKVHRVGDWLDASTTAASHEAAMLKLCSDKAASLLKWKAILDVEMTVAMTMQGYMPFIGNTPSDTLEVCRAQMAQYTSLAAQKGMAWAS